MEISSTDETIIQRHGWHSLHAKPAPITLRERKSNLELYRFVAGYHFGKWHTLSTHWYAFVDARTSDEAIASVRKTRLDLILLAIDLRKTDGLKTFLDHRALP